MSIENQEEKKRINTNSTLEEKPTKRIRKTPTKYEGYEVINNGKKEDSQTNVTEKESLFQITDLRSDLDNQTPVKNVSSDGIKKQNKMLEKKQLLERLKKKHITNLIQSSQQRMKI